MLGYVLVRQPTVILRRKSECFDTCQCFFLIITVTTVTPVMPVFFYADVLLSIYYKPVTPVICYSPIVFDFISD